MNNISPSWVSPSQRSSATFQLSPTQLFIILVDLSMSYILSQIRTRNATAIRWYNMKKDVQPSSLQLTDKVWIKSIWCLWLDKTMICSKCLHCTMEKTLLLFLVSGIPMITNLLCSTIILSKMLRSSPLWSSTNLIGEDFRLTI